MVSVGALLSRAVGTNLHRFCNGRRTGGLEGSAAIVVSTTPVVSTAPVARGGRTHPSHALTGLAGTGCRFFAESAQRRGGEVCPPTAGGAVPGHGSGARPVHARRTPVQSR